MGCGASSRKVQPALHSEAEADESSTPLSPPPSPSSPLMKQASTQTDIEEAEEKNGKAGLVVVDSIEVAPSEQSDKMARMIAVQPFRPSPPRESEAQGTHSPSGSIEAPALPGSPEGTTPTAAQPIEPVRAESVQPDKLDSVQPVEAVKLDSVQPVEAVRLDSVHPVVAVKLEPIQQAQLVRLEPVQPAKVDPVEPVKLMPIRLEPIGQKVAGQTGLAKTEAVSQVKGKEDELIQPLVELQTGQDRPKSQPKPEEGGISQLASPGKNPLYSKSSSSLMSDPKPPQFPPKQRRRSSNAASVASLPSKRKSQGSPDGHPAIFVVRRCCSSDKLASGTKLSVSRESLRAATHVYATSNRAAHDKKMTFWSHSRSQESLKGAKKTSRGK